MRPDDLPRGVVRLLAAARQRRAALDIVVAVSAGIVTLVVVQWLSRPFLRPAAAISGAVVIAIAVSICLMFRWRRQRTLPWLARHIETLRPRCRNLIVTAEELHRHPERASSWMSATVMERASQVVDDLRPVDVAPARQAVVAALIAVTVGMAALVAPPVDRVASSVASVARSVGNRAARDASGRIVVIVRPPAYAQAQDKTLTDPQRLDVLQGSLLTLGMEGSGSRRVRFGAKALGVLTAGGGTLEMSARDSGYFAIEPTDGDGRTLIVLSVTRDHAPSVRVEHPARDLLLPDAGRSIAVTVSATDDLGLGSLELRYMKMSGAGEQFQFNEGTIPLRPERGSPREWRAHTELALPRLQLAPGDAIVYRAVATDRRPRAEGLGASETFFIEIQGPGQASVEGVDLPPDEDRYAFSQQMIVQKIERLQARVRAGGVEAGVEAGAALIAAEQRTVRAYFVFLMGGHVEDEEEEAAQSTEISEGRLLNTARRDINAAIRDMTRAEQALTAVNMGAALTAARSAVNALQRAFGRSRYFLRTLATRSRVDPSRRLTGNLSAASDWSRDRGTATPVGGNPARSVLGELLDLSNAVATGSLRDPAALDRLAERALAVDPSSSIWQDVSQRLLRARAVVNRPVEATPMLDAIVTMVMHEADRALLPRSTLADDASPLLRAWEGRVRR